MVEPLQRVRDDPRLALNGLTEYLVSTPLHRQRVLENQKRPNSFQTPYYREAREAIQSAIVLGSLDPVLRCREDLTPAGTDWEQTRRLCGLEALSNFEAMFEELPFVELERTAGPEQPPLMNIEGVAISVRPEVLVAGAVGRNEKRGGVKLYFSKKPLAEGEAAADEAAVLRANFSGVILRRYLEELGGDLPVDYRLCFTLDIMAGCCHCSPRAHTQRMNDVQAACGEISARWPFL